MADIREIRVTINSSQANSDLTQLEQRLTRATQAANNMANQTTRSSGSAVSEEAKFLASLQRTAEQAGKTRSEIAAMNAARMGPAVQAQAAPMIAQLRAQEEAMKKLGHSAGGVNAELFVLAHELAAGDFKSFGGSLLVLAQQSGGITGALKGLVAMITPVTAGLALAAGAVAVLGAAFYKGTQDAKEFNNTLALTNNYAGLSKGALVSSAASIADATKSSYGDAKEAIMGLAASGKFTAAQIQELSPAILNFSKLSGKSIEDVTKKFAEIAGAPTKVGKELNETMHFMSIGQIQLVEQNEALGKKTEAAHIVTKAFNDYMASQGKDALEGQVHWYTKLTNAVSEYWNEMSRHVSGNETPQEKLIAAVQKRADLMSSSAFIVGRGAKGAPIMGTPEQRAAALKAVNDEIAFLGKAIADGQSKLSQTNKDNETKKANEDALNFLAPWLGKLPKDPKAQLDAYIKAKETYKKARDAETDPVIKKTFRSDAELDQAQSLFAQSLINPVTEENQKKAYANHLSNLDEFIKDEQQNLQFRQAMLKAEVAGNRKTQEQGIQEAYDLQQAELKQEIKYTEDKIAEAKRRIAQNPKDEGALQNLRDFTRKKQELENQQKVDTANLKNDLEANATAIKDIYGKLVLDLDKAKASSANAFSKDMRKLTMSANEAALLDAQDAISADYAAKKAKALDDYKSKKATGSEEEMKTMKALSDAEADDLALAKQRWAERIAAQADWKGSAIKTFKDYVDEANNVAGMTSSAIRTVMGALENTLATFFKTFKFNLRDFATAIEDQLAQIAAKQTAALLVSAAPGAASAFMSLFGGAKAGGGDVDAGKSYWVGENGPEKFVPTTNGTILPSSLTNKMAGSSTSISPTINLGGIHVSGAGYSPDQAQAIGTHVSNQVMTRVLDELRHNGMLSSRGR